MPPVECQNGAKEVNLGELADASIVERVPDIRISGIDHRVVSQRTLCHEIQPFLQGQVPVVFRYLCPTMFVKIPDFLVWHLMCE